MFGLNKKTEIPTQETALPGREMTMPVPPQHFVLGTDMLAPWPANTELAMFGMGCFWGAERKFWQAEGVHSTQVGYAAGLTPNPTYEEVCSALRICLPCFGKIMIRPRACVRAMISARNTVPEFTHFRPNRPNWLKAAKLILKPICGPPAMTPSPRKFWQPRHFIMPRITTSNIWAKTRTVIAAWAERAWRAPLGLRPSRGLSKQL